MNPVLWRSKMKTGDTFSRVGMGEATQSPDPSLVASKDERFDQLYQELRRVARRELVGQRRTSLQTTVLVHETYLRLDDGVLRQMGRVNFLALAGRVMRCVLVDHIRGVTAQKRGGDQQRVTLLTELDVADGRTAQLDVLAMEQALLALAELDPRLVTVVECRFHAGMEFAEIGEYLAISERTAQRDWRRARAFLLDHLGTETA